MNKEDFELIEKEFKQQKESNMQQTVITKTLIDDLMKKYNRCSYTELYYDSDEGKSFNNWCDPYEEGIWGMTNKYIRKAIVEMLKILKKSTYKDKRFYISCNKDNVVLYYYSRDIDQMDYWFSFWNEENRNCKCDSCKKDFCYMDYDNCNKKNK